jgi:hypothetical protein
LGESFKRKRAKSFRIQQDRAYRELAADTLLTRCPEEIARVYSCRQSSTGEMPKSGSLAFVTLLGDRAVVTIGNRELGDADAADLEALRKVQRECSEGTTVLDVTIGNVSPLTREFEVRLKLPENCGKASLDENR